MKRGSSGTGFEEVKRREAEKGLLDVSAELRSSCLPHKMSSGLKKSGGQSNC